MINNSISKIEVQALEKINLKSKQEVKCIVQGENFLDAVYMEFQQKPGAIKLNKNEYVVLKTGEIKTYKEQNNNKMNKSLKRTFNDLRCLIRTNFTEKSQNQLFITLTYEENMQDEKRLYTDFEKFIKRLKYRYKEHELNYIVVAEPQGRGAWHMHVMLKSNKPVLYIDNKEMEKLWGFGFTDTERLRSNDVGSYYVAYFTDLIDESDGDMDHDKDKSKMRQKGERLKFYPKNFKFYRCSRGIEKPLVEMREYGDLIKEYGQPKFVSRYEIDLIQEGEESREDVLSVKVLNRIQKEYFCKKK